MDYGIWQGAERATGRALQTGMGIMQYNQQRKESADRLMIEQQRLNLAKEAGERENKAFANQQAEFERQKQLRNAYVPASLVNPQFHRLPSVREKYLKMFKEWGAEPKEGPDGEIFAPSWAFDKLKQTLHTGNEIQLEFADMAYNDLSAMATAKGQEIQAIAQEGKTDDKTKETVRRLKSEFDALHAQMAMSLNMSKTVQEKIAVAKAKIKEEKSIERIEAEAAAKARGSASVKSEVKWTQLPEIHVGGKTIYQQQSNTGEIKRYTVDGKNKTEIKPPTPQAAAKRLSDIEIAEANIDKADKVTSALAAIFPEYAKSVGQRITPEQKAKIKDALVVERSYLKRFAPDSFGYVIGETRDKDGVIYEYIGNDEWKAQ